MAYILSLATASPDHCFQQKAIGNKMIEGLSLPTDQAENLRKLYKHSAIHTRYSVLQDFNPLFAQPTTKERNEIYKKEAPKLAIKAAKKALSLCPQGPSHISHIISVSCTGMMAPGIEYYLIKELDLRPSIGRIGINFMGCFGAFNALSVAAALSKENANHRILIVCTELCSLHGQIDLSSDTLLANALFADGAAACIVGGAESKDYLWKIEERSSMALSNSTQAMSWDLGNNGYFMKLSTRVPILIKRNIMEFAHNLIAQKCAFEECHWAIHPGGKSIIKAIEKECNLLPSQTTSSWRVLKNYGNMSSATFLFVLEESLKIRRKQKWTLGIGFGPGLSVEGILLKC